MISSWQDKMSGASQEGEKSVEIERHTMGTGTNHSRCIKLHPSEQFHRSWSSNCEPMEMQKKKKTKEY
jgi:hypothetical protein